MVNLGVDGFRTECLSINYLAEFKNEIERFRNE